MHRKTLAIIAGIGIGIPVLAIAALSAWAYSWTTNFTSRSPDGAREIRVQTRVCFADCVLRITALEGQIEQIVTERADCWFEIGHVTWVGQVAMIHVPDGICTDFHQAYDFKARRQVNPAPYETALRDDVQLTYAATLQELEPCNGDVLKWMNPHEVCMIYQEHRALDEFRRRHPR
jgi:hypothetical protein